jgi:superfamily II DNA/RNA helicase
MSDFVPNFTDFDLDKKVLKVLEEIGYVTPTPIQAIAIPKILERSDIIASAQTGTGKTAAFMLPALHLAMSAGQTDGPKVLILVPTRELAVQVADEAKKFSKYCTQIKTVCLYGGVPYPIQKRALSRPFDILVATPGRLIDLLEQGRIDFSDLQMLILDEADRMLDMGFSEAVEQIVAALPEDRQTLLFSATIDQHILPFSRKLQKNAFEIKVEASEEAKANIESHLYYVDNIDHKIRLLEHLLENTQTTQLIVFTSTINQTIELSNHLRDKGYESGALHGDMDQVKRTRTINNLRQGKIDILVATDVAARGIDIASLSHVINFDLPYRPEDFIHRIGRTGRAGAKGLAITFATYREDRRVREINKLMGVPIEIQTVVGIEPKARPKGDYDLSSSNRRPRSGSGPRSNSRSGGGDFRSAAPRSRDRRDEPRGRDNFRDRRDEQPRERRDEPRSFTPSPRSNNGSESPAFNRPERTEKPFYESSRPRFKERSENPRSENTRSDYSRSAPSFARSGNEDNRSFKENSPRPERSFRSPKPYSDGGISSQSDALPRPYGKRSPSTPSAKKFGRGGAPSKGFAFKNKSS